MFRRSKNIEIKAAVQGQVIALENVPDPVFAQKMMGEGVAIEPENGLFVAPFDGKISLISPTKHAFGMENGKGVELLVHIGIDTVGLDGEGFEVLCEQGTEVKQGTPIIRADLDFIKSKGINTITPMIVLASNSTEIITDIIDTEVTTDSVVMKVQ